MGFRRVFILLILLVCLSAVPLYGQAVTPSEQLTLTAKSASTWTADHDNIIALHGPVKIELDHAVLTADDAVIWLKPSNPDNLEIQDAQISLIGNAKLQQPGITRKRRAVVRHGPGAGRQDSHRRGREGGARRFEERSVSTCRGVPHRRVGKNSSHDEKCKPPTTQSTAIAHPPTHPQTKPAPAMAVEVPVVFEARDVETVNADDGTVAVVLKGGVRLFQQRPTGEIIELSADRAVGFTPLKSLKELQQTGGKKQGRDMITSAYLEGDVRIDYLSSKRGVPEQRLSAVRVYYEFATDRAVLTDAIIHTIHPQIGTPIVARARLIRQLSNGEYNMENARVTNSLFAVPKLFDRRRPALHARRADRRPANRRSHHLRRLRRDFPGIRRPIFLHAAHGGRNDPAWIGAARDRRRPRQRLRHLRRNIVGAF